MRCPACNTDGAYVGLNQVECVNQTCRHARPRTFEAVSLRLTSKISAEAVERIQKMVDEALSRRVGVWRRPVTIIENL